VHGMKRPIEKYENSVDHNLHRANGTGMGQDFIERVDILIEDSAVGIRETR